MSVNVQYEATTIKQVIDKLIKLAHSLDAYNLLDSITWGCYFPDVNGACGNCPPCGKRD